MKPPPENAAREPVELLVADIGSTITKVSAFAGLADLRLRPRFLGQGTALSTVGDGDIGLGLAAARRDLQARFPIDASRCPLMAASSAAGGLRMSVHGLTRDMTLRAAREASLGAGAIIVCATSGRLRPSDLDDLRQAAPDMALLAGGVDDGDRDVVLANARALASLDPAVPVIYAGNKAARREIRGILEGARVRVFVTDNVYPRLDELNLEPVRSLIQEVFARHIVTAPGMAGLRSAVTGSIVPTPAAVLRSSELLVDALGDVMTVDVGGATTDVHSVTEGSPENSRYRLAPEPRAKRTVEGDLGIYVNASHVLVAAEQTRADIRHIAPIPDDARSRQIALDLTRWAVDIAVWRHAGTRRVRYGALGQSQVVEGRDLSAIRCIVGTGGALTRLGSGEQILRAINPDPSGRKLLPPRDADVVLDNDYIMCAAGVLSQAYPDRALPLLLESVGRAKSRPD